MDHVYHFTTHYHLPWILNSGALLPGKDRTARFPHDDFLWATTNPKGERTATMVANDYAYRSGVCHHVRFTLSVDDFFPWADVRIHHPEWSPQTIQILNQAAARPGDPANWYCRATPLPMDKVIAIDHRSYFNNVWRPIESREAIVGVLEDEILCGIEFDGKDWFSRRMIHPETNAYGYEPVDVVIGAAV